MGKHFGNLATVRGIVYYKISHHEQKPFAGVLTFGIPNIVTRTAASWIYWLPPFLLGYFTYQGVESAHHQNTRKNPQDFMNEVPPPE
ncbi:Ubiquinone binding protein [Operophtera brumata]|uniref:Cytochrome b-c1 complex subunit 8 n=1 Tax=Operophtera brumata TaxID=104452 RepID=A0A0L7KPV4_OPEBR|nr:Ubiquinone binding protein [Operophtera brumata]